MLMGNVQGLLKLQLPCTWVHLISPPHFSRSRQGGAPQSGRKGREWFKDSLCFFFFLQSSKEETKQNPLNLKVASVKHSRQQLFV